MEHRNMPGFLIYVFLELIVIAFTVGMFLRTMIDKKDSKTAHDNIVNLTEDFFTRNKIMTSNEIRQVIGLKPSADPEADELRNKNLSKPKDTETVDIVNENEEEVKDNNG